MNAPVAFTKADLKQGYIVECRNNGIYVVVGNLLIDLCSTSGWNTLLDYDNGLTVKANNPDEIEWDIMKVYSPYYATKRRHLSECLELLWERVEVDTRKEAIKKELEYAKAKKLRLEAHIEKLEGKVAT